MTALARPASDLNPFKSAANHWLTTHHPELLRRARARFRHLNPEARAEAVAEALAVTTAAVHRAAQRGTLDRLTPYWCVEFARRQYRQGRRMAGYSSTSVGTEACRHRHGVRTISLSAPVFDSTESRRPITLAESLADGDAESPLEAARRNHDYPTVLDKEGSSDKARATFRYIAETHGGGQQTDLASDLMVSPARITQLKGELAQALGRHDYHGPLGRRPQAKTA